ncbi:MAG: CDP-alcohol phosphatidyltransferase family protein [bacterium]|nr:CDP-alcohol phosphatidyltransferase family protein [bacterium]
MLKLYENDPIFKKSVKIRLCEEIVNIQIFRPLAHIILLKIKNKNIKPEMIVVIHTIIIFCCSLLILISNSFILNLLIFLFLQLKTVLDNLDGQLARYKNIESSFGRYFDTLMDYIGNLSIFMAIGIKHGELLFSIFTFYILTVVLSYDYNFEKLCKGIDNVESKNVEKIEKSEKILRYIYNFLLGYQDKIVQNIENYIISKKNEYKELFWNKRYLNITVNMGLSTQLLILGIFILFGAEKMYLFIPLICLFIIILLFCYRSWILIKGKKQTK